MSFLQKAYNREEFINFLKIDFLPDFANDQRVVGAHESSLLKDVHKLGDSARLGISIFETVCDESDHGKRVAITQDAFRILRDTATRNALVVFYSENKDSWRLSLLTSTFDLDKSGKVISKLSNPRRYSYLLGPKAKTVTPYQYLVKKGAVIDFADLQKRFSVEVVNKEFYNSVAELFTKLVGGKRKKNTGFIEYPGLLKIGGNINQSVAHQEFAVRLIGRLVFCWFLREKRSSKGISLIPDNILSAQASNKTMYYHSVLEPLFFELLNQKQSLRKEAFKGKGYSLIPYLNGGLFNPQKGDAGDNYEYSEITGGGKPGVVDVPDSWLREFTELLDTYNFTVDENTSYDIDLSVDPEMLGRIFENLLAEINPETGESARKSTGSFYTPREVVEYMVDRSLVYYLESKTQIDIKKLEALVSYDQDDDQQYHRTIDEEKAIVGALGNLTILDPACGSGAYPIGILQKVVYVLQQVDKDSSLWLEKQLSGVSSPELRKHLELQYKNQNYDYIRKIGVIRDSIFGVDIQAIATEIARLRCFLTLIVEESVEDNADNRGIHPLPNLDFKFVTANSLLAIPKENRVGKEKKEAESVQLFEDLNDINDLAKIRSDYFSANPEERIGLQAEFHKLQKQMTIKSLDNFAKETSKMYAALSRWEPFEHYLTDWFDAGWMFGTEKFDIVIANPPYLGEKGHKDLFRKIKEDGLEKFYQGKMDLFYFFFHHALNLNKEDGITAFITTNYYPTATGAKKLRKDFYERTEVKELINFNELRIFESALGQHNMITILQRSNQLDYSTEIAMCSVKGTASSGELSRILSREAENVVYSTSNKSQLFDGKDKYIRFPSGDGEISEVDTILSKMSTQGEVLGSFCNVNTGLYTAADKVFILDSDLASKVIPNMNNVELELLKPLYKNSDVKKIFY